MLCWLCFCLVTTTTCMTITTSIRTTVSLLFNSCYNRHRLTLYHLRGASKAPCFSRIIIFAFRIMLLAFVDSYTDDNTHFDEKRITLLPLGHVW